MPRTLILPQQWLCRAQDSVVPLSATTHQHHQHPHMVMATTAALPRDQSCGHSHPKTSNLPRRQVNARRQDR